MGIPSANRAAESFFGNLFITVIMQITVHDRRIDFACKLSLLRHCAPRRLHTLIVDEEEAFLIRRHEGGRRSQLTNRPLIVIDKLYAPIECPLLVPRMERNLLMESR